jgi:hypothetical protein
MICILYIMSGLKNLWVCGFGCYDPIPMPVYPLGTDYHPLRNPRV